MTREFYNAKAIHEHFSDLSELRAFSRRLIEHWDRTQTKPFHMGPDFVGEGGGPIIWSFANHVVNLMRTVIDLSEKDQVVHAAPLIRLIVENTMTAVWLYLEPSNVRAIIREGFRLRKAAIGNVVETKAEGFNQSDIDEIDGILDEFDGSELPSFEQRCRQVEGGLPVYCIWRVLSTYSHAGMGMGDFYLEEIPERPYLAFVPEAKLPSHEAWLGTAVCMLIAAMKVCNLIDGKGSLKSQVERAEKKMGITLDFAKAPTKDRKPRVTRP